MNCAKNADKLGDDIAGVDGWTGSQDAENAHWHGMVDGTKGEEGRAKSREKFSKLVETGRNSCGKEDVLLALHALSDWYAPAHQFKPWFGKLIHYPKHWRDGDYNAYSLPAAIDATESLLSDIKRNCPCFCECGLDCKVR